MDRRRTAAVLAAALLLCPVAVPSAPAASRDQTSQVGDPYVLGASDKVKIRVFGEDQLTGDYTVAADGTISLPLVGQIRATGLTTAALQDSIVRSLRDGFIKDPQVSVEVSTFRPFYILGEVQKPGEYPYVAGLTVLKAVATAGGFSYRANKRRVFIRRTGEDAEQQTVLTSSTPVHPGDTVRIGERFF